jgi:hypothetical protein
MTLMIGPPYFEQQYADGEVGAFFDSLAGVYGQVGAPIYRPMPQQYRPPMPQRPYGPGIPSQRIIPSVPGAPAIGVKLQPLGFTTVAFTATSGTALPATTRPQKPFKGKRLVVDIARTGATATGLVTVTSLTIGVNNQFVSTNAVGAGSFAAGSFDTNVELSACSSALDIVVNYAISAAPAMTDRVDIATTLFGETVGS